MGDLLLGTVRPDALYSGAQAVSKVYWGAEQVWPADTEGNLVGPLVFVGGLNPVPGEYKKFNNRVACNEEGPAGFDMRAFWQDNDGLTFRFYDGSQVELGTLLPSEYTMQADAGILYPGPSFNSSSHPLYSPLLTGSGQSIYVEAI